MKKRIMLLGIISIISLGIIGGYNYLNNKDDVKYNLKQSDIAIMVYDHEIENYVKQSSVPKGAKYSLNEELTKCESGGKVTDYSKANGTLKYEVDVADQCYVYFDVDNTPSYAIYSETDNSLIFYKNNDTVGEEYNGRVVTAKYDDVENSAYTYDSVNEVPNTPWYGYVNVIKTISVANKMTPVSTMMWFKDIEYAENIDLTNLDTSSVTTMERMFENTGELSTNFSLNLGNTFDTLNVTNMIGMFQYAGYTNTGFVLDLGDNFDTSSVTNMSAIFNGLGYNSTSFALDLGDKFDTSKVTSMNRMFQGVSRYSNSGLNLGDKFDTSNVIDMQYMFATAGQNNTNFSLELGNKFNTSNVTNMKNMFAGTGYMSTIFMLNLGNEFDTSNVTNMQNMFAGVGNASSGFTLDLGSKFDTSNVTTMRLMFDRTGNIASNFELDVSLFVVNANCDVSSFAINSSTKIIFGEGWANATLVSGMFKRSTSTPIEIVNAPANILAYDFASDNRVPTFTTI